jgi:curved DNA-binding protein CbpA
LEDVKRSYKELVKVWHPDRFASDSKLQQRAGEKIKQINLAYERICEVVADEAHKKPTPPNSSPSRATNYAHEADSRPAPQATGAASRSVTEPSGSGFATAYRWSVLICCCVFACWISNGWGLIPISILALIFLSTHKKTQ